MVESVKQFGLDAVFRCDAVYPADGSTKDLADLQTVMVVLTSAQALKLGAALVEASKHWGKMGLAAKRLRQHSDGTHEITLLSR